MSDGFFYGTARGALLEVTPSIPLGPAKLEFWRNQAALLDPRAYRSYNAGDGSLPVTVPVGETWFLRSGWYLESGDVAANPRAKFFRNAAESMPLSAGTLLAPTPGAGTSPFAYVCQPALVTGSDVRYQQPEDLYYARLSRLNTFTQLDVTCDTTTQSKIIPVGVSGWGMVLWSSIFECPWLVLTDGAFRQCILQEELDDSMAIRFSASMMLPFDSALLSTLERASNIGGAVTPPAANITYVELPADW